MIITNSPLNKIQPLSELINQKIHDNSLDEILIIVPTNRRLRHFKKEIVASVPGQVISNINLETLATLTSKLLNHSRKFRELSEATSIVLIKQCTKEIKLNYFSLYHEEIPFGTLDRIKNVISEYKYHGISADAIKRDTADLNENEKLKANDIANIYQRYIQKCHEISAFEIGDVYKIINQLPSDELNINFISEFGECRTLILQGFTVFSIPEIEIISKLASIKGMKVFLDINYPENHKNHFSHITNNIEKFKEYGFSIIENSKKKNIHSNHIYDEYFFRDEIPDGELYKIAARDPQNEIEICASEIKKMILKGQVQPSSICMVFNLIQNYSPIVKDVFSRFGIPFNLTDRILLANTTPVTAIINLLEILENDFYYKNVLRALSSGYIDKFGIKAANLQRVSVELKIVSGRQNWIHSLNDALNSLYYEGEESSSKKTIYTDALNDIKKIIELLNPFDKELTIDQFLNQLKKFIVEIQIPFRLLKHESEQEKNVRSVGKFVESVDEVFNLLELQNGKEKKYNLSFYLDQIRTICKWARFNVKEKSNYGVQITTIDEIKGFSFDHLFVCGLIDGEFPTKFAPEVFTSGSFKKQAKIHLSEERLKFYTVLHSWNKKLYLSYPQIFAGKETVCSVFLKELENPGEIPLLNMEVDNTIYTREDEQIFIGKKINSHPDLFDDEDSAVQKIKTSISIDSERRKSILNESAYNGYISYSLDEDQKNVVEKYLAGLRTNQYSITQLETYAKCPFKYFVERILNVKASEEPSEDVEALEMGKVLHSILYNFYTRIRELGIVLAGCGPDDFERAKKIIFEIAGKELNNALFKSPLSFYEKEKIMGLNGNERESILYRFLETERSADPDFVPEYFEVGFGNLSRTDSDSRLSSNIPLEIVGVNLRGKIDRVEIDEKRKLFNIVDYKLSGAKPKFEELKNGISLQLPVYMYAANQLLNKKFSVEYSPNEMMIYSLKYQNEEFGKSAVTIGRRKEEEVKSVVQLIERSIEFIKTYLDLMEEGKFNLSPHENRKELVCRNCSFNFVCRVEEFPG